MRNTIPESESSVLVPTSNASELRNFLAQKSERTRKCCPFCGSLRVERKVKTKDYLCLSCLRYFCYPHTKITKPGGNSGALPKALMASETAQMSPWLPVVVTVFCCIFIGILMLAFCLSILAGVSL